MRRVDVQTTVAAAARWLGSFRHPVPLVGYSQGGRIALLTALEHPSLIERVVLVSASPGIRSEAARMERRARDAELADYIERVGVDEFLNKWLTNPITGTVHIGDDARRRDRAVRSANTASGLAASLRGLGQGAQPYVGDRIRDLRIPLLTVSGNTDTVYTRLALEMAHAAPNGTHVSIAGAGHNVILDDPQALASALADFTLD
jgi:2-succinyl-6-hydroxy-2,4-cyclohexadiene-1-carboxylate synthase